MKTQFLCLALLSLSPLSAVAATTTIYDQWLSFNKLEGEKGQLTVTLHGTENTPSVNNGSLTLTGDGYASVDLSGINNKTWSESGYTGIQLVFSASNLSSVYEQLFLINPAANAANKVSAGVAMNNAGAITDGNKMASYGQAFTFATGEKLTLTAMYSQTGGVRYYINGELVKADSNWKASGVNWGSLDIGKNYAEGTATHDGLDLELNGLVLFSVDSTNAADVNAAAKNIFLRVPEPTTASLGLLGMLALMARRRRA